MGRKIRVIQYGVGEIGKRIVRLLLEKPTLRVVAAVDIDPRKTGSDLGEVVSAGCNTGVVVTRDAQAALKVGADIVLHSTSSYLQEVADQLIACLEAGVHTISTCEELAYPFRKHPDLSQRLDRCAREHNVVLLGTGVNPGFAMDKLMLTLAAAANRVVAAKAIRIVDASKRRLPLQKKIGAGLTVEEFNRQVAAGMLKHHGLPESVAMVADGLGFAIDEIAEIIQPVIAKEQVKTEYLEVSPGQVAGVHQIARGVSQGKDKVWLELCMYVGAKASSDTIELMGEPNLTLTIPGGLHGDLATAAVVVNCIPAVLEAKPGLRTSRDIPMSYFAG